MKNTMTGEDAKQVLMEAMLGGASFAIERQEKRGQQELVYSDLLPTDGLHSLRAVLNGAGGSVGEAIPEDPMFTAVTLPPGWSKRDTDHRMWSALYDDKNRKRASIFYKAAFYDRSARISPCCRYYVDSNYDAKQSEAIDTATGAVLHVVPAPPSGRLWDAGTTCQEWLKAAYPECDNPAAYWDGVK